MIVCYPCDVLRHSSLLEAKDEMISGTNCSRLLRDGAATLTNPSALPQLPVGELQQIYIAE